MQESPSIAAVGVAPLPGGDRVRPALDRLDGNDNVCNEDKRRVGQPDKWKYRT